MSIHPLAGKPAPAELLIDAQSFRSRAYLEAIVEEAQAIVGRAEAGDHG